MAASFLAAMWLEDEEQAFISPPLPVSSAPSSGRKLCPRCQSSSPKPDSGASEQPAVVSDKDAISVPLDVETVYSVLQVNTPLFHLFQAGKY